MKSISNNISARLGIVSLRILPCLGTFALAAVLCSLPLKTFAIPDGVYLTAANGYNNTFLNSAGNGYKTSITNSIADYYWNQAEDIQAAESIYEHSGSASDLARINTLVAEFIAAHSHSWVSGDTWNDDLGRAATMLARAYILTGVSADLTEAEFTFNTAYNRGWSTTFNGGGIYEQMGISNPSKDAIANSTCGTAAILIFQATGDSSYKTKAEQIYSWERATLFLSSGSSSGKVHNGVYTNGIVNTAAFNYNQAWYIEFANALWENTGISVYYNDALLALNYDITNCTEGAPDYILGGVGAMRAVGHFISYNNLWSTYYTWMLNSANTGWANRWTTYNVGWNSFGVATPQVGSLTPNQCLGLVEWLQFVPPRTPPAIVGTQYIYNKLSGRCLQSPSSTAGATLVQWGYTGSANQQWVVAVDSGTGAYTLKSVSSSLMAEDSNNSSSSGNPIDQNTVNGQHDQVWSIKPCQDGFFKIVNYHSGMVMAVTGSSTSNGATIEQETDIGAANQRWTFIYGW